jgi:uncharacterized short protein YbdD (DUF466 family)
MYGNSDSSSKAEQHLNNKPEKKRMTRNTFYQTGAKVRFLVGKGLVMLVG